MSSSAGGYASATVTCSKCGHEAHEPGLCSHWLDWCPPPPGVWGRHQDPDNLSEQFKSKELCPCGILERLEQIDIILNED